MDFAVPIEAGFSKMAMAKDFNENMTPLLFGINFATAIFALK